MIDTMHFLRPEWLPVIFPLLVLFFYLWLKNPRMHSWRAVCDKHLLDHLVQDKGLGTRRRALILLLLSGLFITISLAGPSWSRLPTPAYRAAQPRVLILDMSDAMLTNDLAPDRLTRAKFKLHDLFKRHDAGQFGLIVFTAAPFVVSPLTSDGKTIDTLLETLTPDIMPVRGHQLNTALEEAAKLITQAGFTQGQLLVLTATPPDAAALKTVANLKNRSIFTSVMPVMAGKSLLPLFQPLATAGNGEVVAFSNTSDDLDQWLKATNNNEQLTRSEQNDIPVWRDEGRWFLFLALLLLLPVFRRGWLQRVDS